MSNRIFLDSSVLIEYRKGNNIELFEKLVGSSEWIPCISQIVISEYLFHHLAIFGGKAPLSLKMAKNVENILLANDPDLFLGQFEWLQDIVDLKSLSISFMKKHNLLPNDALILSICKVNDVKYLASLDADFKPACIREKITLVSNTFDLFNIADEADSPF